MSRTRDVKQAFAVSKIRTDGVVERLEKLAAAFTVIGLTEAAEKIEVEIRLLKDNFRHLHFSVLGEVSS